MTDNQNSLSTSGIRDNHSRGSVGNFLVQSLMLDSQISVVSAYFTIFAYEKLKSSLNKIDSMQFLFGEPRFISNIDPEKNESKAFIIDNTGLQLSNILHQRPIARECADWIKNKVSIRSVRQTNLLHGKMYHINNSGVQQAILGSSNFTPAGLGLSQNGGNIELNLIVDSDRDRRDLKDWFDHLWRSEELTADVKNEVLQYLAQIYKDQSPEFIYFKTLFHLFENFLDSNQQTNLDIGRTTLFETEIWKSLFDFQKDGVKGAINKIRDYNGCIIADSTGLGKTYTALAIIKYFELRNERVLVLCPKKLRQNWTVFRLNDHLNPFCKDRFRFDVLSHTDLSRESGLSGDIDLATINWANYDFVVIDESHNFRNDTSGKKDAAGNVIRKSRYQRLMDNVIKAGIRTKVLLLSATPVNNNLKDIRNQLYFISAGDDGHFASSGIPDLAATLNKAQKQFTIWSNLTADKRKVSDLLARLGTDFFKILDSLTIARARKHIVKYYAEEMEKIGKFPKRLKPQTESPDIDVDNLFLSYDKISDEIDKYSLSLFKPSSYLKTDLPQSIRNGYLTERIGNFTQENREKFLVGMMKVNFLKRLESSIYAFHLTMERTINKITKLEERLDNFDELVSKYPDLNLAEINAEFLPESQLNDKDNQNAEDEDEDEQIQESLEVGKKFKYKLAHIDIPRWRAALREDKRQLHGLKVQALNVTPDRDNKLLVLKGIISNKLKNPTINKEKNPNRKILIFSAFSDTASYLYFQINDWALKEFGVHTALVAGSKYETTFQPEGFEKQKEFNQILTNFSPISKKRSMIKSMPQEGEIDILIATDCISEGQNLQDCDYLINYDIHWNPVRIIQRFGRIDRIGSLNESIQLVNFWPTANLDNYINLQHRVEARMALVDVSATQEDNPLSHEELEDLITEDIGIRDKQLRRLQDEIVDLEDLDESLSLTDFNLDDFRIELLKFLDANRSLLESTPFGLYSLVPGTGKDGSHLSESGVIFCLRQKTINRQSISPDSQINPTQPYYLVYLHSDGNVRLNFFHPKQILTLFRQLCAEKSNPDDILCAAFDLETSNGHDMSSYNKLLECCLTVITGAFKKRLTAGLQFDRNFILPSQNEQVEDSNDFELITWLIIKK